jgi:hypothetical protein
MKGFGNVWACAGERVGGWRWKHRFFVDNDHGCGAEIYERWTAAASGREEPDLEGRCIERVRGRYPRGRTPNVGQVES